MTGFLVFQFHSDEDLMNNIRSFQSIHVFKSLVSSLAAGALWIGGSVSAAMPGTPIANPRQVIEGAASPSARDGFPSIVRSANDAYLVLWGTQFFADGPPSGGVRRLARQFNADGVARGPTFELSPFENDGNGTISVPLQVAMAPDGRFVTASIGQGADGYPAILVRSFRADGTPEPIVQVASLSAEQRRENFKKIESPSIAINAAGEYVVAWTSHVSRGRQQQPSLTDNATTTIHARRFAFDGRPLGPEQIVAQRSLLLPSGPPDLYLDGTRIAMNDDGDYAIGYVEVRLTQQLLSSFKARVYRADGSAAGLPSHFALFGDRGPFINIHDYALSFAANGDLLFAWATRDRYDVSQVNPTSEDIWLARYTRVLGALVPAGPAAKVATRAANTSQTTSLNVSPTPSGGSVITWPDPQFNSATRGTAWGRYYDARELPLSEPFLIGSGTNSVHSTTDSRGNLLAAWDGVFVRKFQGP